jgi:hypothetical protein
VKTDGVQVYRPDQKLLRAETRFYNMESDDLTTATLCGLEVKDKFLTWLYTHCRDFLAETPGGRTRKLREF